jgi:hypothetical protein
VYDASNNAFISCSGNLRITNCFFGDETKMVFVGVMLACVTNGGRLELNNVEVKNVFLLCGGILVEGEIILNENTFSHVNLIEKSIINITGGDSGITGCIFNDIKIEDGNGSVINANVENGNRVDIIGIFITIFILYYIFFLLIINYFNRLHFQ